MNKSTILTLVTSALVSTYSTISFAQMQEFQKVPTRDAAIEKYIADNKIQNVKGSPDGFYYVIEQEGTGNFPQLGKEVLVHYVGTRLDGKKFDSSRDRGQPFSFPLGQGRVIKGWDKGIPLFKEGSRGKLFLPAAVAYGERGAGADIPANTPLVFDIEVIPAPVVLPEATQIENYMKSYPAHVFTKSPDGLLFSIENKGTTAPAKLGDKVVLHFVGKFLDGRVLGDSHQSGNPLNLSCGQNQMLPGGGFDKAFQMLGKGGKGQFIVPSDLGLGKQGAQGIPPGTPLVFDLEVIDILDAAAVKAAEVAMNAKQQTDIEAFAKTNNLAIKKTASGLNYYVETQGTGAKIETGKNVSVHYTGKLLNGTKFDSSLERGEPIKFPIGMGNVIKGWDEGIPLFNVGGKGKLLIPSYLAYGEQGPPNIGANAILIFDIEVVGVE